jgi:hypothetical protein
MSKVTYPFFEDVDLSNLSRLMAMTRLIAHLGILSMHMLVYSLSSRIIRRVFLILFLMAILLVSWLSSVPLM